MRGPFVLPKPRLDELIAMLWSDGFRVLGPVERDGGVVFDEVRATGDMPVGRRDSQEPGRYRLSDGRSGEVFGVVNGPGSLKPSFFSPEETLLEVRRKGRSFTSAETMPEAPRLAFIGVRACDLAAVAMQDRIFLRDRFHDSHYAARRDGALMIAVDCTRSVATCFCTSMRTGPRASAGFDLALTEMDEAFVLRAASARGETIAARLGLESADAGMLESAERAIEGCATSIMRRLDTEDLPRLLYREAENPRWDDVASRCLSCTNCTMVCPTCFCHTVLDEQELDGNMSRRVRKWDSCFSLEHAHIHGVNFRPHVRERYRQWLTHKLASWIDQFGGSGCVGCGRCITWCPVGIDLTEEVAAIRAESVKRGSR
jgi:sulfhydrogenase subunit beta (sulfur reductase)